MGEHVCRGIACLANVQHRISVISLDGAGGLSTIEEVKRIFFSISRNLCAKLSQLLFLNFSWAFP